MSEGPTRSARVQPSPARDKRARFAASSSALTGICCTDGGIDPGSGGAGGVTPAAAASKAPPAPAGVRAPRRLVGAVRARVPRLREPVVASGPRGRTQHLVAAYV